MVKCGETLLRDGGGACKTLWDSPCVIVLWKLLITFQLIFGACLIGFCDKTAEIHSYIR